VGGLFAEARIFGWCPSVVEWFIVDGKSYCWFAVWDNYWDISRILLWAGECSLVWAYEGNLEWGSV